MNDIVRLEWNDDFHKVRWAVNPGITGFAQVYGGQHRKTSWLMNVFGKTRVRRIVFQKSKLL